MKPLIFSASLLALRGGSWVVYLRNCRSAYRSVYRPVNAFNFIGFRVVCLSQEVTP